MKTTSIPFLVFALVATALSPAWASVKNGAVLQGNILEDGSVDLNSGTPKAIFWNLGSSVDPSVFEHSFSDGAKLKVLKDGDYLVAVTAPYSALPDAADNRPVQTTEVYVNGTAAPGAIGQSSYIRNQPRNANIQLESSDHVHTLLRGLKAGDVIEVKVNKHGTVGNVTRISPAATIFAELVDSSRTVFAGLSGGPTGNNANLLRDVLAGEQPAIMPWNSARKDAGFTHTDGTTGISLGAGNYLVFVNIPLQGAVARGSVGGTILLNNTPVIGGNFHQGYIRNSNGHIRSSIHYAGVVQVTGNQTLSVQTVKRAGPTSTTAITVQPGKQASIYIERLPDTGAFSRASTSVDDPADPTNWNPLHKTAIIWEGTGVSDAATFNHTAFSKNITVRQAGSYLLLYNDQLQSTVARPNPKITVQVNGTNVRGAETKSHYIRSSDGHNHATASLAFMLDGLQANDVITVSTQAEGNTGVVTIDEFAFVGATIGLVKREALSLPADDKTPPRIVFFNGNVFGFEARIEEFSLGLNATSVKALLNGKSVPVKTSRSGKVTTITYSFDEFPASGSSHTVSLSYNDTATPAGSHQAEVSFLIRTQFTGIPASFKAGGVDTSKPGFVANISSITSAQVSGGFVHGNTIDGAEKQLAGGFINPDTKQVYLNESDLSATAAKGWTLVTEEIPGVINWEQAAGAAGNFTDANGFPDALIPKVPGSGGIADGVAAEILTYLELKAGFHTLGVNSDDGFQVASGPSPRDREAAVLGFFNGGRGSADTLFNVVVREDGIYPFRLLWFEGLGGANVEFFSVVDDQKILINDRNNSKAIKAYRAAQARPYLSKISPASGALDKVLEFQITDADTQPVQASIRLSVDGVDKTGAAKISKSGRVTTVSFDNGDFFSGGEHTAVLSYDESSTPPTKRTVNYKFAVPGGMSAVLLDSPIAYWRFNERTGTLANSEVGTGLQGTYFGGPTLGADRLVPGAASTSVLFDKSKKQYLDIPDHPDINDSPTNPGWKEKSIEFWFKPRNLPTNDPLGAGSPAAAKQSQVIYEQGGATRGITVYLRGTQPGPNPAEAQLWCNILNRAEQAWGGILPFEQMDANGAILSPMGEPIAVSTTIKANATYHVAFVMKGDDAAVDSFEGTLTGYLNGQKFAEKKGVHLLYDHTDDIAIGARNEEAAMHDFIASGTWSAEWWALGDLLHFDGWIDEFALYNRALTADQVKAHYDAGLKEVPFTPAPTGAPKLALKAAAGAIQIEFDGTLQSADSITGPWTDVAGGSPFSVNTGQGALKFYRAKR